MSSKDALSIHTFHWETTVALANVTLANTNLNRGPQLALLTSSSCIAEPNLFALLSHDLKPSRFSPCEL